MNKNQFLYTPDNQDDSQPLKTQITPTLGLYSPFENQNTYGKESGTFIEIDHEDEGEGEESSSSTSNFTTPQNLKSRKSTPYEQADHELHEDCNSYHELD